MILSSQVADDKNTSTLEVSREGKAGVRRLGHGGVKPVGWGVGWGEKEAGGEAVAGK